MPRLAQRFTALVAGLLAWIGVLLVTSRPLLGDQAAGGLDFELYRAMVNRVQAGADYYHAAALELRVPRPPEGLPYPTRSVFNWRPPTLALLLGKLGTTGSQALLAGLGVTSLLLWWRALAGQAAGIRWAATVGLASGLLYCVPGWLDDARFVHETWAGVLLTLALGAGLNGWLGLAVAAAVAAACIRELAVLSLLVFIVVPFAASSPDARRERLVWAGAFALALALWAAHAWKVQTLILPTDRAHEGSWLALGGWRFVLKTAHLHPVALPLLPSAPWALALVLPFLLWALVWWPLPRGGPVKAVLGGYVVAYLFVGQPFNFLWGLVYTPLLGLGLGGLASLATSPSTANVTATVTSS
jgi:hypothetical protein